MATMKEKLKVINEVHEQMRKELPGIPKQNFTEELGKDVIDNAYDACMIFKERFE